MANFLKSLFVKESITTDGNLISNSSSGDEGGEINLARSQTNNTLSGSIVIDSYQNKLRFFENGGSARGAYIDLTSCTGGAGTNLLAGSGGATTLDGLSDVVITSPEEFQGLSYNGTSWVNGHIPLASYVRNAESTTITTGTCVYLYGATGDHATVKRADNSSDTTSSKTIGVAGADITASNNGPIITRGYVDGIDLSTGYAAGDILWLGTNGAFTKTKPTSPDHLVFIGVVVRATNNGIIYVATQNGYELDEIHNVSLPSPQSGEFLKYNGSLWVADAIDLGTDTVGNYMSGISGTSPVSVSHTPAEGSSATVSLASGYGDTQNPYASKTANYVLAGPTTGSASAPAFRALVDADIPSALTGKTYNGLSVTTTTGYLSMADGKTLSVSNSLTFAGTDSTTMTFPSTSSTVMTLATPGTLTGTLTLRAGTATAGTAPLYLTSGTNLTVAAAGAVEFDGTNLYFTPSTTRKTVVFTDVTSLSSLATVGTVTSGTIDGGSA